MTIPSINPLTAGGQNLDIESQATPEQREVARQFEAIFLRQILSGLQKTDGHGGDNSGDQLYRSMMIESVADSAAEAGGIGLSEVILRSMLPPPLTPEEISLSQDATADVVGAGDVGANANTSTHGSKKTPVFVPRGTL